MMRSPRSSFLGSFLVLALFCAFAPVAPGQFVAHHLPGYVHSPMHLQHDLHDVAPPLGAVASCGKLQQRIRDRSRDDDDLQSAIGHKLGKRRLISFHDVMSFLTTHFQMKKPQNNTTTKHEEAKANGSALDATSRAALARHGERRELMIFNSIMSLFSSGLSQTIRAGEEKLAKEEAARMNASLLSSGSGSQAAGATPKPTPVNGTNTPAPTAQTPAPSPTSILSTIEW